MIHRRTMNALFLAMGAGYLGGYYAGAIGTGLIDTAVGVGLACLGGAAALWVTPHAEEVAIRYREHERLQEDQP